jgi:hypothetical protein
MDKDEDLFVRNRTVPKKRRADKESKSRKKQKQTMEEDQVVEEPEIREITIPTPEYVTLEFSSEEAASVDASSNSK